MEWLSDLAYDIEKWVVGLPDWYFSLYDERRMLKFMIKQAKKRGTREPITGFYQGCPVDHIERRILMENGGMVQCLKCMRVFHRDRLGKPEWNKKNKYELLGDTGAYVEPGQMQQPGQIFTAPIPPGYLTVQLDPIDQMPEQTTNLHIYGVTPGAPTAGN